MVEKDELTKMGLKGLLKELGETRADLFKAKFEVNTGQEKATHKIKRLKIYIAQILTIMNENKEQFEKEEKEEPKAKEPKKEEKLKPEQKEEEPKKKRFGFKKKT